MEEDIKILEDIEILESECYYLEELGYLKENNHFIRFNQALKNLIKGYKEKEESEKYLYDAYQDAGKKMFEYAEELEKIKNDSIPKSKIREIVDECIPRGKNVITGKEEYQANTNANSFLTQEILKLLEEKV